MKVIPVVWTLRKIVTFTILSFVVAMCMPGFINNAYALSTPSLVTATVHSISGATMDVKISYSSDDIGVAGYQYSTDDGLTWKDCDNPDCSWSNASNWLIIQKLSSANASMQTTDKYKVKIRPCSIAFSSCSASNTSNAITAAGSLPATNTYAASSITSSSATLNGNIYSYSTNITSTWFLISTSNSTNANGMLNSSTTNVTASPSTATANTATDATGSSTSLNNGTTYYFQVNATNSAGTSYGDLQSFTTLSTDATLGSATVKGAAASLGTPNATLGSAVAGAVTITQIAANDTSNTGSYVTSFSKNFASATTKVVKYASGANTTGFSTDTAYNNTDAITPGDFFIIEVTAQDGTTILYYRVDVTVGAPVIATSSTIATGASSPSVTVTGNGFKSGIATSDLTIGGSGTGLTISTVARVSSTEITVAFTGTAAAGTVTIEAKTSAFSPVGSAASNALTITVAATATTNAAEVFSKNRAKVKGESSSIDAGSARFCIKTSDFSDRNECASGGTIETATATTGANYELDLTSLSPSTTYYVIFYGESGGSAVEGTKREFKTKPQVVTNAGSSITARSAKFNATVSETLTDPKFCYKTTSFSSLAECLSGGTSVTATVGSGSLKMAPPKANKSVPKSNFAYLKASNREVPNGKLAGDVNYSLSLSSLDPNSTYYFIIYGTVDGAEYDGGVQSLTTPAEESSGGSGGSSGSGSSGSSETPVINQAPRIVSISKSQICFVGSEILIVGEYFTDGKVTLNSESLTVSSLTSTSIRVSLPQGTAGRKTISVTTPYGTAATYIEFVSVPKPVFEPIRIPYLSQGASIVLPFLASNASSYGIVGKLPAGLTINSTTGEIAGTATENGIFVLVLKASNICGETQQVVELDIDAPTPNAISHRINFLPGSCTIPDSAKASLEAFLEKAKGVSPRNIIPEIYVSGGGKANDPNSPIADCRQEAICDFLLLENLLGEVLSDVFTGAENRVEIIVYWPRPNDDL